MCYFISSFFCTTFCFSSLKSNCFRNWIFIGFFSVCATKYVVFLSFYSRPNNILAFDWVLNENSYCFLPFSIYQSIKNHSDVHQSQKLKYNMQKKKSSFLNGTIHYKWSVFCSDLKFRIPHSFLINLPAFLSDDSRRF